ncbi:hypothetical protein AOLI_G00129640 [Acnodon oligacanthus]
MVSGMHYMGLTPKYEKYPQTIIVAPPCFTVFTVHCGLNSVFRGRLTNCLWPLDPVRTILLSFVHRMLRHFSLGQSLCSLANCNLFSSDALRGFLANSLASCRRLLIVTVLTGN